MSLRSISFINDVDQETICSLIDFAYNYTINSQTPLKKLSCSYHSQFSKIADFFSQLTLINIDDLKNHIYAIIKDKQVAELLYQKAISISQLQHQKILLLEPSLPYDLQMHNSALEGGLIPVSNIKFELNVRLLNNIVDKILKPEIVLTFELLNGNRCQMHMPYEMFEQFRRNMAMLMKHIHQLELNKLL